MALIEFTGSGIYCRQGDFYIDPWLPVKHAVITHGHGDHARTGMKNYLCHSHSAPVLRARLGEDINIQHLEYGESQFINGVKLSLHPAGHIFGSAQVRLEYLGKVVVISGDYKLEHDGISTPFELVKCHEFVTETTFGLPIYNWRPQDTLFGEMQNWIRRNREAGKTSVFIAYSLGKAQRLMKGLEGSGNLFVHFSINRLNKAIETTGTRIAAASVWDPEADQKQLLGEIVILPPSLLNTNIIKKIPSAAKAICSGWMQVRGSRRWQAVDAGFALSDHAGWKDLLYTVKGTAAEKIYVTHGFTSVFSRYLNENGWSAEIVPTHFGSDEESPSDQAQTALV